MPNSEQGGITRLAAFCGFAFPVNGGDESCQSAEPALIDTCSLQLSTRCTNALMGQGLVDAASALHALEMHMLAGTRHA